MCSKVFQLICGQRKVEEFMQIKTYSLKQNVLWAQRLSCNHSGYRSGSVSFSTANSEGRKQLHSKMGVKHREQRAFYVNFLSASNCSSFSSKEKNQKFYCGKGVFTTHTHTKKQKGSEWYCFELLCYELLLKRHLFVF